MFSLSKLILVKKKKNSQFRSITQELNASFDSLLEELRTKVVSLISRYVPSFQSVPLSTGLKWFPIWTASSVPYRYVPGEKSPFHRMIWDLFSVALWDKARPRFWDFGLMRRLRLSERGPFSTDMLEWSSQYIVPVFSYFFPSREIDPLSEEEASYPYSVNQLQHNTESRFASSAAYHPGPYSHCVTTFLCGSVRMRSTLAGDLSNTSFSVMILSSGMRE